MSRPVSSRELDANRFSRALRLEIIAVGGEESRQRNFCDVALEMLAKSRLWRPA